MVEFRVPRGKSDPTGPGAGRWRTTASFAGFFGALPFGLLPYVLTINVLTHEWKSPDTSAFEYLFWGLLGLLPLVPFAVALSRAGRDAWPRALGLVIPALVVGTVALFLYPLGLIVYPVACGLGLLLGLAAIGPCWRRGDAEGRALALLGLTPALCLLGLFAANRVWHHGDRDVDAAAPTGPSASLPLAESGPDHTAAPDPSWLWRWEYLLALVAVGLAVGAWVLFRRRRRRARATRPRGPDAAGAETPREAEAPGREVPSPDVASGVAGPLKGGKDGGQPERFRLQARALGVVWVVFGSTLLPLGAGLLWSAISPHASVDRGWREILLFAAIAAYGLALVASGVGTCLRSRRAIGAGLALSCVGLALGFAADRPLSALSVIGLALALIYLALRTIGLAGAPRHDGEVRRGVVGALRQVPARLAEASVNRVAVAVLGCSLGGTVGGLAGGLAGSLIEALAVTFRLVANEWGLRPVFGLAVGGMAGVTGGWVGGLIQGTVLGASSPRLKAVRLYAGTVLGPVQVMVLSVRIGAFDWGRSDSWLGFLETLLLGAATGALGAWTAGLAVGSPARAFADRGEGRAGTHPLDD